MEGKNELFVKEYICSGFFRYRQQFSPCEVQQSDGIDSALTSETISMSDPRAISRRCRVEQHLMCARRTRRAFYTMANSLRVFATSQEALHCAECGFQAIGRSHRFKRDWKVTMLWYSVFLYFSLAAFLTYQVLH